MRLGDLDRLAKDIEMAVEDAPLYVQATVQQYIDCSPTIDPIRAAGGCRCGECHFGHKPHAEDMQDGYVYCEQQSKYKSMDGFCDGGEPKEAQDDG